MCWRISIFLPASTLRIQSLERCNIPLNRKQCQQEFSPWICILDNIAQSENLYFIRPCLNKNMHLRFIRSRKCVQKIMFASHFYPTTVYATNQYKQKRKTNLETKVRGTTLTCWPKSLLSPIKKLFRVCFFQNFNCKQEWRKVFRETGICLITVTT